MTISAAGPFLERPARLGAGGLQAEGDAGGGRLDAIDSAAAAPAFHLEADTRVERHQERRCCGRTVEAEAAAVAIDVAVEIRGVAGDLALVPAPHLVCRVPGTFAGREHGADALHVGG